MPYFENEYITDQFQINFHSYKDKRIVLYGIGNNTKLLLERLKDYNIIGLMDAGNIGKTVYGLKVLSMNEIIKLNPIIIIIARPSVVNLIFKRISILEEDHNIPIFNIEGQRIKDLNIINFDKNNPYWTINGESLQKNIDRHDVISFDIFDTLIMRKIYLPSDVFYIVEERLREQHKMSIPFAEARINAENSFTSFCPTFDDIYNFLQVSLSLSDEQKNLCKNMEILVEHEICIPRIRMREFFYYTLKEKKKIYLVSDMYLPLNEIKSLLDQCGITGYHELLVSCQEKASKESGILYGILLQREYGKKILHIGDNERSDIHKAAQNGLNVFYIASAKHMLELSVLNFITTYITTFENRLFIGLFISKIFNDPFILYNQAGKPAIADYQTLGYLFIAPYVTVFFSWFIQKMQQDSIKTIIFSSRDGYLFFNLYEIFRSCLDLPRSVYLIISRRLITLAAASGWEDIELLTYENFYGSNQDLLNKRFGINANGTNSSINSKKNTEEFLNSYNDKILSRINFEKKNFMTYWHSLEIEKDEPIGFFDFIAAGTVQHHLQKLVNKSFLGYYFLKRTHAQINGYNDVQVQSLIEGEFNFYEIQKNIIKYHFLLEAVFSSPEPTVICVDENGEFQHYKEIRSKKFIDELPNLHQGIITFVLDYASIDHQFLNKKISVDYADALLSGLSESYTDISESIRQNFVWEDEYCGVGEMKLKDIFAI
jgi:hypothetical protein